ncbi:tetratricopeptide repeat protein [Marinomonas transparens]|uniref:Tetratricopeptide repeat protein n=1 Tax=Marinomonas transparens TaxID=2795388 RepID=A0A934JY27_9GAMM|nr:tetratricopeptide repeat protein [Marinomonas transparens]MBJ7539360.1 tetratricopeptide repeat protein [Marinomonas transparens]
MSENIVRLRCLVADQQFNELKIKCLALLTESFSVKGLSLKVLPVKVLLALAYAHLGEFEKLSKSLASLEVQQDALDNDALCDLAAVYIVRQQLDRACILLERVIEQVPEHDLALARLGWCHMAQGESERALALFERSLVIQPQRMAVKLNRIQLLIGLYDKKAARSDVLPAVPSALEDAAILLTTQQGSAPQVLWKSYENRLQRLRLCWWVVLEEYGSLLRSFG